MTEKARTEEMAKLFEGGMTLQQIGDRYGISRQRVQQRFKEAGLAQLARPPKYTLIDKDRLENLYAEELLTIARISEMFGVKSHLIHQALNFHKIPKRGSINTNGKYIDRLRELKIGERTVIDCPAKKPHVVLHKSAKLAGGKISMRKLGSGRFQVTRIY